MCNNCIHKAVCSIYRATGGVKKCEHHKEERRGRWKPDLHPHDGQPYRDELYGYVFKCSACGGATMGSYDLECRENYCPQCGADMRGE